MILAFVVAAAAQEVAPPALELRAHMEDAWARRRRLQLGGMGTLVGFSAASLVAGGVGWGVAERPQDQAFFATTLGWSVINLGIGIPALVGATRDRVAPTSLADWRREDVGLRGAFLFNAGLDIGWVLLGGIMWQQGLLRDDVRWVGAGQAVIVQGGFLLGLDVVMAATHGRAASRFWAAPVVGERLGLQVGGRW